METPVEDPPQASQKHAGGGQQADELAPVVRARPFPEPPKSTIKHGTIPQEKFWAYRKALKKEFHDRLVFFVYREWPILDFYKTVSQEELAEMRAHKKRRPIKYIAKYADIDPDDWRNHLLQFHGSGIYKILLNDSGVRGDKKLVDGQQVCSTTVELRDDEYPPVVDIALLDMNDPANGSFINSLRMKGISLPGDAPKGEGVEDMAATVAVEKLADALVEQSKAKAPQDNTAATMLSDLLRQSEARHLKELELAEARHVRDLEAITKRLEAAEKTAGAAPTTTQQVIEMARAIVPPPVPPPQDNKMVDVLMQLLKSTEERAIQQQKLDAERHTRDMDLLNKRLEAQEKRAADLEAARLVAPAAASGDQTANTFKVVLGAFEGFNKLKERIVGDADTGGTGNPWVDLAAELGPKLLDTISTVTTAVRSAPPAAPQQQTSQVPGVQIQQQQPTALSAEQMMIERIKAQLLQALGQNMPGSVFGGGIMFEYGEGVYHYLAGLKENGLMSLMQQDGVYWGQIQQVGARVPQFLAEFLDGPSVIERAQAIRAGQGQRPTQQVPQQQARPNVVDAVPASQVQQTGGRTIIREGGPVKTAPLVNGPLVDPVV